MTITAPAPHAQDPATLSRTLVLLLATTTGLCAGALYYSQPLLAQLRHAFGLGSGTAGLLVTVTQVGYLAGLLFLVPVGDLVPRRTLLTVVTVLLAGGLAAAAAAPSAAWLVVALLAVGVSAVAAQITVATAATLAPPDQRGRTVGTVMSGLLLGILLARTVSGALSGLLGWRGVFGVAAGAVAVLAVAIRLRLPHAPAAAGIGYRRSLRSLPTLLRDEPVLRMRALLGGLSFATFSAMWTALTFLLADPPYGYSPTTIGLFGLAGLAGAAVANLAGRIGDRGGARLTTLVGIGLLLASWAPLLAGAHGLGWLLVGVVLLDLAVQAIQVTNQSEIYRLRPEARSRLTSVYMASYFLGGVGGSAAASAAYATRGWSGVCAVGAALSAAGVLVAVFRYRSASSRSSGV